jgi:hypothetical protein
MNWCTHRYRSMIPMVVMIMVALLLLGAVVMAHD